MKLRFLAAAGPEAALRGLEQRMRAATREDQALVPVLDAAELNVWTLPGTPALCSADGTGALVGLLFDRGGALQPALPQPLSPERILGSYWGPYVLFTASGRGHAILRDPSGAIPVYHGSAGGLTLFASDPDLLEQAWPETLRPDLHFIRQWLAFPFLRTARTGALGISELLPGSCRSASRAGVETLPVWSSRHFTAPAGAIRDFDAAARALRETILATIPPLAAAAGKVAVQLSGGLDSSIVAAALHRGGIGFEGLTFATLGPDGDERAYARAVAAHCGAALIELREEERQPTLELQPANKLRPPPNPLLQPLHRTLGLQVTHLGCDAVLDGAGGDNVFASLHTGAPAIDAFRWAGASAALHALADIAEVHNCTLWAAGRSALRRVGRGTPARWPQDTRFLSKGAVPEAPEPHPWMAAGAADLPGAADHLRMIAGIHHFLADPAPLRPAGLHPLLAQPILELCLSIPSWLWVRGGRDRAVARAAFEGLVPSIILERRRKGSLESMLMRGYLSERRRLEPFLLEGRLAQRRILDRASLEAYLRQPGEPRDGAYIRVLEIAAAEQWLRSFDA